MASFAPSLAAFSAYRDRHYQGTDEEYAADMERSCTLYCGNLSFYTTEEQLYEVFSQCGEIKRIIMGLDRHKRKPCGFCFVEFYRRSDATDCMKYVSGTKVDDRLIRTDLDPGFVEGRQFGRGRSGGQVRDEVREDYDAGRGGYGVRARGGAYDDMLAPEGGQQYGGGDSNGFHASVFSRLGGGNKRRQDDDDDDDADGTGDSAYRELAPGERRVFRGGRRIIVRTE